VVWWWVVFRAQTWQPHLLLQYHHPPFMHAIETPPSTSSGAMSLAVASASLVPIAGATSALIASCFLLCVMCHYCLLRVSDPVRANQTRLPALGLLPLGFC
jgi:hypothetical protein